MYNPFQSAAETNRKAREKRAHRLHEKLVEIETTIHTEPTSGRPEIRAEQSNAKANEIAALINHYRFSKEYSPKPGTASCNGLLTHVTILYFRERLSKLENTQRRGSQTEIREALNTITYLLQAIEIDENFSSLEEILFSDRKKSRFNFNDQSDVSKLIVSGT